MPHSRLFLFRFALHIKLSYLVVFVITMFATAVQAAEWRECEKAKLHELKLQQNADEHKTSKRKSRHRSENNHQSAEEIDTWLWKNCREFSYELRQLEQEKM